MTLPINQIIQGDCIEKLQSLPEKSVDLVFADPPYNLRLQNELRRPDESVVDAVDDKWDQFDSVQAYDDFSRAWLHECRRVMKDTATIWVIGSYHNIFRLGAMMMDMGFWILNDVIWEKQNPMPNFRGRRFTNATETLIWAKKSSDQKHYTFNYQAMKHLNDEKQMRNVWHIPLCTGSERIKLNGHKAHSTQKPEALLYRVIMSSTDVNHIILDPFFGTGTTGAVARKLKRNFIGIERSKKYVKVARNRLAEIPEVVENDMVFRTPSRRDLPRVPFGTLLEAEYVHPGQKLFSRKRDIIAVVNADSRLSLGELSGSIHQLASHLRGGKGNVNGWDFWFYEDARGDLISIDRLRQQYRDKHDLR